MTSESRLRRKTGPLALSLLVIGSAWAALPGVTLDARPLGLRAVVRSMPATVREDAPDFFPPAHVRVTFQPDDGRYRELRVYPVDGLLKQYPERRFGTRTEIDSLKALLRERPAPREIVGELPYIPLPNAGQVVHGAVRYVDFPGGRGVRFLIGFSQDVWPLSREQVLYAYQGITNDGKHYVSFEAPYDVKSLPTDTLKSLTDKLNKGGKDAEAAWKSYIKTTAGQLDALTNDAGLQKLDRVVQSLRIR